jgi:CheY-like chemotaxis protein
MNISLAACSEPQLTILCIDPNPAALSMCRFLLESRRYRVLEAHDLPQAQTLLETETVHAIASNVFLPSEITRGRPVVSPIGHSPYSFLSALRQTLSPAIPLSAPLPQLSRPFAANAEESARPVAITQGAKSRQALRRLASHFRIRGKHAPTRNLSAAAIYLIQQAAQSPEIRQRFRTFLQCSFADRQSPTKLRLYLFPPATLDHLARLQSEFRLQSRSQTLRALTAFFVSELPRSEGKRLHAPETRE